MNESIRQELYQSVKEQIPNFWLRLAAVTVFFLSLHLGPILDAYSNPRDMLAVLSCYLAYVVLTECTNSYFIRHIDRMITNLPRGTFTKLKAIYPLLLAGFVLSSAFFTYCILLTPTGASFKDPLVMIYGTLWVLVMYYYYNYQLNPKSLDLALWSTNNEGEGELISIPSIILAKVHDFDQNLTVIHDVKGDRYFVEGNKLQTILDSYFGDKFEKRDGELLISKDFWKDKNKPLSKRFYLLSVMGGMSEVALSAFKSVTLDDGLYTVLTQSDVFFMPALDEIDVLFPARQFEIEDNWAGPKGQDRTIITQQLHELVKKHIAFLSMSYSSSETET
ncbi:MAG TPA: hypothetical protein VN040_11535 [Pseudosphingobacterium sp.]|nr:hypothetical protein [Pseudosphingobacterium sp.]